MQLAVRQQPRVAADRRAAGAVELRPAARARRWRPRVASGSSMAASSSRSSVSSARTVTPTMPWPAAGTIASGSSTTRRLVLAGRAASGRPGEQRGGAVAGRHLGRAASARCRAAWSMRRSGRACSSCAWRRTERCRSRAPAGRRRTGRRDRRRRRPGRGSARRARPRASACRRARCPAAARSPGPSGCAPRNRCGRRPAPRGSPWRTGPCRRYRPGGRSCTASPVVRMACSSNTSHVRAAPGRSVVRTCEEDARLPQRERRAAGADAQRQRAAVRRTRACGMGGRRGMAAS